MGMLELGIRAKQAGETVATLDTEQKNKALSAIADALEGAVGEILEANAEDIQAASAAGISEVMIDRLRLTEVRITAIASAVRKVVALPDPIGCVDSGMVRPNGLTIYKTRTPLGVVGIIYESRPNVTVDAAALCLKSGNVCILRGGKEAINTNKALAAIMRCAIEDAGVPADAIILVEDTTRESSYAMMKLSGYIDVLIPRGGAGLIRTVVENSTVPVIETGAGNCHVYVDSPASFDMAVNIVVNAKCSRPSVCNAAETLLVHKDAAEEFLPLCKRALDKYDVKLLGCQRTIQILGESVEPADEEAYATEFNDYIMSVKVVDSIYDAIEHIRLYSTGHSEAIVTDSYQNSRYFVQTVDSAAVYVNASTRFTDGEEFGMGAEIGISTQKLHTRGPMGLGELTTIKYVVLGEGQIR